MPTSERVISMRTLMPLLPRDSALTDLAEIQRSRERQRFPGLQTWQH